MRWLLLLLAALVLGGGVGWWMDHDTDRHAPLAVRHQRGSAKDAGPTLYRWIDAAGVVNVTDTLPKGRHYTIVRIDPNRNIVPMAHPVDPASIPVAAPRAR